MLRWVLLVRCSLSVARFAARLPRRTIARPRDLCVDSVFQAAVDFGRNGPRETDVTMHSFDSSFLVHVRDCLQFELNGCDGVGVGVTVTV